MVDTEALTKVVEYATALGLHGLVIMSPVCPKCGLCHDWLMQTDVRDATDSEAMSTIVSLLRTFLDSAENTQPITVQRRRPI